MGIHFFTAPFLLHHIGKVLDDDDRCFLIVIAERIIDQDLGDLLRVKPLALSEDGRAFQIIDICDDRAVSSGRFLDLLTNIVGIRRTIDEAFVERRHGAGDIIDQRCLTAAGVEYAVLTKNLCDSAEDEGEEHVPFPFFIHGCLHTVDARHGARSRYEAVHETGLPADVQLFRADVAVLCDGDDGLCTADDVMVGDLVAGVFQNGIDDVVVMGEDAGVDRYEFEFCHLSHLRFIFIERISEFFLRKNDAGLRIVVVASCNHLINDVHPHLREGLQIMQNAVALALDFQRDEEFLRLARLQDEGLPVVIGTRRVEIGQVRRDDGFIVLLKGQVHADKGVHDGAELLADILHRQRAGERHALHIHGLHMERRPLGLHHLQHTVAFDDGDGPVGNESQADQEDDDCQNFRDQ